MGALAMVMIFGGCALIAGGFWLLWNKVPAIVATCQGGVYSATAYYADGTYRDLPVSICRTGPPRPGEKPWADGIKVEYK